MRATDLLIAIGAGLGFASADLVCNPNALQNAAQVIAESSNEGFKQSVRTFCGNYRAGYTENHFGSITLGLNRTCAGCVSNNFCALKFDSIIEKCVVGKALAGGTVKVDGMTTDISINASLDGTAQAKARDVRNMGMARMVKRKPKAS